MQRRIVLASAVRLGLGRGFDQDLIPSERFYAGGGTSVRGFAEDGLGGVDFFGDPRGGNGMLILNQEARVPLFGWVHGVAFVDAGNVFEKASEFSLTNLEAGAGGGLRINSPFALLRIDFGVPLTNRPRQTTRPLVLRHRAFLLTMPGSRFLFPFRVRGGRRIQYVIFI